MIMDIRKLSTAEQLNYILTGVDYSYFIAFNSYTDYNQYREGNAKETTSVKILSLLDNLGYPMDELGTYLYKELIENIIERIKNVNTFEEIKECREYLKDLRKEYSQTYHSIAREDLELGISSFHEYIREALSKVDYSKADMNLIKKLYSRSGYNLDYGEQAFLFASYILGKLEIEDNMSNDIPNIRKLSK